MSNHPKKSAYKTGVRSRGLILDRLREYGKPADITKLSELTGMDKRHVRYTVGVMISLGMLYFHHYEKNRSNRSKAFYFIEPNKQTGSRQIINNIF